MVIRRNPDTGRRAVTLLATAFVVLTGATLTAFVVLSFAERGGWQPWAIWGSLFGLVVLVLWSLYERPEGGTWRLRLFWFRNREQVDPLTLYKPRKRRFRPEEPWGSNQPPTLESLRETAQETSVRWVPHDVQSERPRKPK
jgi:hypothetical protein